VRRHQAQATPAFGRCRGAKFGTLFGCGPNDVMFVGRTPYLLPRPDRATPDDSNAVLVVVAARRLHATKRSPSAWGRTGVRSRSGRPPFLGGAFVLQPLCKLDLSCASLSFSVCFRRHHDVLRAGPASASPQPDSMDDAGRSGGVILSKGSPGFQSFLESFMPQPNPVGRWNSPEHIAFRAASGALSIVLLFERASRWSRLTWFCVPESARRAAALALAGDLVVYSNNTGMHETLDQIGSDRDRRPIGRVWSTTWPMMTPAWFQFSQGKPRSAGCEQSQSCKNDGAGRGAVQCAPRRSSAEDFARRDSVCKMSACSAFSPASAARTTRTGSRPSRDRIGFARRIVVVRPRRGPFAIAEDGTKAATGGALIMRRSLSRHENA
jgi:hypothetical protein